MFYCRQRELKEMNRLYNRGNFECIIIYGRRRIGKTALINEFCKDKKTIFFSAINASSQENLENLSKEIYSAENENIDNVPIYQNFDAALDKIGTIGKKERLVFVIDEYPYLAKSEESFSSRLQHIIDHKWQDSKIFLILCGSSMNFMENQVLGYESPLYGRRTAQFKIQPLNYKEITEFNKNLNIEQQALIYGITGGIPHYINKLDIHKSIDDALLNNFFNSSSYLFEEPENLLKQELREPAVYNSIITAIANGYSHLNEIATKIGQETGLCLKYIKILINLGIIKKENPITEISGKKSIYVIEDNFFRFWYKFVPKNITVINSNKIALVYKQSIKQFLSEYMGLIFEKMCKEYLLYYAKNLPINLIDIGQWWGTDKKEK
ncbi:MAG: ATP-binding protein, partial [Elusimicrobia bacterium]|nr:ATP-binding protein [Elusimicrobiota bacterium]